MSLLPIVERELRVASRRAVTYRMRFWVALGMLITWLILLMWSRIPSPAMMGQHLLNGLGILALTFSMVAGVFLTADCLSEEKREGTLGLLFLTDLKSYDVVIGKLTANSIHAFFGLLAVFPILGLTLLLGGVTGGEFWRLALVFIVTLFFSLSLGMAVSAMAGETKQALTLALLWLVVFAGVLPALWWLQWALMRRSWLDFLLWPSPVYTYMAGFDVRYHFGNGVREFWRSLGTLFGLGVAGIIAANIVLPRSWQVGNSADTVRSKSKRRGILRENIPAFRPSTGWLEPMYWLFVRDGSSRRGVNRALLVLVPIWGATIISSVVAKKWMEELFTTGILIAYGIHLIVKVLLASEAGRRMTEDRRSGAWELLLVTPLKIEAILSGQRKALRRHFGFALFTLCAMNTAMIMTVLLFHDKLQMDGKVQFMFCEMFIGGILSALLDFYGMSWVGMWRGLRARTHVRAVLGTVCQIMAPQWGVFFFLVLVLVQPNVNEGTAMFIMAMWFFLGFVVDIVGGATAHGRLRAEFRTAVLGRSQ